MATAVYYTIPSGASSLRDNGAFLGTASANYNQTTYGYETFGVSTNKGRENKTVTPDGTITRYVLDARGNVLNTWMGTNDADATDSERWIISFERKRSASTPLPVGGGYWATVEKKSGNVFLRAGD